MYTVTRSGYRATATGKDGTTYYSGLFCRGDKEILRRMCDESVSLGMIQGYTIEWVTVQAKAG